MGCAVDAQDALIPVSIIPVMAEQVGLALESTGVRYQARVYSEPSRESNLLLRIEAGAVVHCTSNRIGEWREIVLPDGLGYILDKQLEP